MSCIYIDWLAHGLPDWAAVGELNWRPERWCCRSSSCASSSFQHLASLRCLCTPSSPASLRTDVFCVLLATRAGAFPTPRTRQLLPEALLHHAQRHRFQPRGNLWGAATGRSAPRRPPPCPFTSFGGRVGGLVAGTVSAAPPTGAAPRAYDCCARMEPRHPRRNRRRGPRTLRTGVVHLSIPR